MEASASQHRPDCAPKPGPLGVGHVADHKLIRMIGQGSYGQVWLAQNVMGVYRAVKIVYRHCFDQDGPFEREYQGIRQFEPISRSHDGFIDIMHIGRNEEEGYYYYIMELADDRWRGQQINPETYVPSSLAGENRPKGRLPLEECLRYGLVLSDALYHLHQKKLIHRDIKPSNILFVDGVPKLADIGLVAPLGDAPSYVGTEGYIPPEGPGTVQADIYSLGKSLYEISTGKDRQEFPELPPDFAELGPVFVEFNEILLKACQNDLCRRYASALEMHQELLILRGGRSIKQLRHLGQCLARIKKTALGALLLAGLGTLIAYPVYQRHEQADERRNHQIGRHVALGIQALERQDIQGALKPFVEALVMNAEPRNEATHRLRCSSVLEQCPKITQFWSAQDYVRSVRFSPGGRYLLVATEKNGALVFDTANGQALPLSWSGASPSLMAVFSSQGDRVAVCSREGWVTVWSFPEGQKISLAQPRSEVWSVGFDPSGSRFVTGCKDGKSRIYETASGEPVGEAATHPGGINYASYSPNGRFIVTCGRDSAARLHGIGPGPARSIQLAHPNWVCHASFSPDGKRLVTACLDRKTRLWEIDSGKQLQESVPHEDGIRISEFSTDGSYILTASLDGAIRFWDAEDLEPLKRLAILRHSDRVISAALAEDGHRVATGCSDGSIRIWDLATGREHMLAATSSHALAGNAYALVAGNQVQVHSMENDMPAGPPLELAGAVVQAQLNWDGSLVGIGWKSGSDQSTWQVCDVLSGKAATHPVTSRLKVRKTALSRDGQRLLLASERDLEVWNLQTGSLLLSVAAKTSIDQALFNQDGRQCLVIGGDRVEAYEIDQGRLAFSPVAMPSKVRHGEYSPDNRTFALSFANDMLGPCYAQVFDSISGEPVGKPLLHRDGVLHVAYSPDGKRIATSSEDCSAVVWDAKTSQPLIPPLKHQGPVHQSSFSPDGRWLSTISSDKTGRLWDVETGEPVTPPLYFAEPMVQGRLVAQGKKLLGVTESFGLTTWTLPQDGKPAGDWRQIAEVLSGAPVVEGGDPRTVDDLIGSWKELKARYAADFSATRQEVEYWHEAQAHSCQLSRKWAAALFHLNRLMEHRPSDEKLKDQVHTLRERIKRDRINPEPLTCRAASTDFPLASAPGESARGLAQSKALRAVLGRCPVRQVVECGSPPPLTVMAGVMNRLGSRCGSSKGRLAFQHET